MAKHGLIGFPLEGSDSPRLFAKYCGLPYDLIEEPDFDRAWERFIRDYDAVNVTSPFKVDAFLKAGRHSAEASRCRAANILVKRPDGVIAYNSDYLAVRNILRSYRTAIKMETALIIGCGGAGKAAAAACEDMGLRTRCLHHDELSGTMEADTVIFTLPKDVPGTSGLRCDLLIEANYKTPCLTEAACKFYVGGRTWLMEQAIEGYPIMAEGDIDKLSD